MELALLIGRLILGAFFLHSGVNHFLRLQTMTQFAAAQGVPAPKTSTAATGAWLVAGGLSLLVGYYAWVGALALAVFLVLSALFMHRPWGVADPMMAQAQMVHFTKNLALAGSLLIIMAYSYTNGAGPLSLGG